MEPIFNSRGQVVGWLKGDLVLDRNNRYRALVRNGNVFSFRGAHLGTFDSGFFRDKSGHCVSFLKGAQGGPITPITQISPIPPIPPVAPIAPIPPIPPIPPIGSLSWSYQDWEGFLG